MSKTKDIYKRTVTNYPVGDFLIRIKNAAMAKNRSLSIRPTKLIIAVANTLKKEGYLSEVKVNNGILTVNLALMKKQPLLMNLKLVSRPGLRHYMSVDEIIASKGPETMIISTSEGVMSAGNAVKKRIGGEVIARVW